MAIFSLNHSAIGRTTHAAGTAGAHVRYITRPQSKPDIVAGHMPADRFEARAWITQHEMSSRKNARVCDKLIIALPLELSPAQRIALLRDFAEELTSRRTPYYAAIHSTGKDMRNPHAHMILIDRDFETGKRVMNTTEKGSTEFIREKWESLCNKHLALAGEKARVDRRSLREQGFDREAQIHVGPGSDHIENNVARPNSKTRVVSNKAGAKKKSRQVDYRKIDKGRTRGEFNEQIIDYNLQKDIDSPDFATRKRAEMGKTLRVMARKDAARFADQKRALTLQVRTDRAEAYAAHRASCKAISAGRDKLIAQAKADVKEMFAPALREQKERKALMKAEIKEKATDAKLRAKVGHEAIATMTKGEDYVKGHLTNIFNGAAKLPKTAMDLRAGTKNIDRELRERQRLELKDRVDSVRMEARDAYKGERERYAAQRSEQQDRERSARKGIEAAQAQAESDRKAFAEKRESEISRLAEAIKVAEAVKSSGASKMAKAWSRSGEGEQISAAAAPPAPPQKARDGLALGR